MSINRKRQYRFELSLKGNILTFDIIAYYHEHLFTSEYNLNNLELIKMFPVSEFRKHMVKTICQELLLPINKDKVFMPEKVIKDLKSQEFDEEEYGESDEEDVDYENFVYSDEMETGDVDE
jgi:hypothetical protein